MHGPSLQIPLTVGSGELLDGIEEFTTSKVSNYRPPSGGVVPTADQSIWFKDFPSVLCFQLRVSSARQQMLGSMHPSRVCFLLVRVGIAEGRF